LGGASKKKATSKPKPTAKTVAKPKKKAAKKK
jgi:hypothetical protein